MNLRTFRSFILPLCVFLLLWASPNFASRQQQPLLAPDFRLPSVTGNVAMHDLRGKVVLVDFWASWCVPCRQSFPWMSSISDRYAAQGLVIVAINLDKKQSAADAFLRAFPATFAVAFDPSGKTAESFNVQAMPSTFIVNRDGQIVYTHQGFDAAKASAVEEKLKEALSQ